MRIALATDKDRIRWNEYCDNQTNLPPLSRFEWKFILKNSYGIEVFLIFALDNNDEVCGILPVYEIKDYYGKSNMYSLKFGLVADNSKLLNALVDYSIKLARDRKATKLILSSGYNSDQFSAEESRLITVTLEIQPSEEEMWKNTRGKSRNMVKKAMKDGITVERGNHNLIEFYRVYSSRMLQKGVRIHSLIYFQNIIENMGSCTQLFIARKSGSIIGGMLLIYSSDSGAYIYGGSLIDKGTSPNQLLLWDMVCFCITVGIKNLDLGESPEGSGVYNFKIWFGGIPKDIFYYNAQLNSNTISATNNPLKSFYANLIRYFSYILLQFGPHILKRKVGIWKRQKGPIQ